MDWASAWEVSLGRTALDGICVFINSIAVYGQHRQVILHTECVDSSIGLTLQFVRQCDQYVRNVYIVVE